MPFARFRLTETSGGQPYGHLVIVYASKSILPIFIYQTDFCIV